MTCLDELVLQQVARTPDRRAVWDRRRSVTFRQLEEESGQLAATIHRTAGSDLRTVAIEIERSVDFVVATVAALRLGAAYCPLSPSEPRTRRDLMVAAACPEVLIMGADTSPRATADRHRARSSSGDTDNGPMMRTRISPKPRT